MSIVNRIESMLLNGEQVLVLLGSKDLSRLLWDFREALILAVLGSIVFFRTRIDSVSFLRESYKVGLVEMLQCKTVN